MVRASMALHLKDAGAISKALLDILVCPISKQPLRYCQETQSIICNAIGVSFPHARLFYQVVDGIPCLVPKEGKIIEGEEKMTSANDLS
ncbi:uncharacterized protein LOC110036903 isoform X2 [Phalaenopsis equestris]|uniref:uncharacterized protein LOC110036903 isoform X2 n=1 Tax=Phalaenopsis equestris TaxID=78828 RepID=UPI0009E28DC2|nr:uncharacterized protein LOC110036903 isoform X2 [Phalaenopsis equestris]